MNRAPAEPHAHDDPSVTQMVSYLKERVYVSFISLAVLLALRGHGDDQHPGTVIGTLLVAAVGAALAGFVSEIIAHLAVYAVMPHGADLRHMMRVSAGALATVVVPTIVLLLALAGLIATETAITVSVWVLAVTLGAVSVAAVRRARLTVWTKLIVFVGVLVLGLAAIGIQVLAHG